LKRCNGNRWAFVFTSKQVDSWRFLCFC
jgi:hypothetical protein